MADDPETGKPYPRIFAFLPDKCRITYNKLWENLKFQASVRGYFLRPKHIIMDFEIAMIGSVKLHFTLTILKGCDFHFGQTVQKIRLVRANCNCKRWFLLT